MSNISRRDFMKTAGVMTLAVAASGVLAGCSTADTTKTVTTGTLSVGESTTVEKVSFTVTGAKLLQAKTTYNSTDGTADAPKGRELYILVTMNSTKESPAENNFDATKLKVYINGTSKTMVSSFTAKAKEDLGDANTKTITSAKISVPYSKSGTPYVIAIKDIPTVTYTKADGKTETEYKTITSIDVVYKDDEKLENTFAYSIDVPTAATYAD